MSYELGTTSEGKRTSPIRRTAGGMRQLKTQNSASVPQRGAKLKTPERGVALLVVMTIIVILTVLAMDFSYNAKVNLNLAANSRDEVKAYYLAKSAVNIGRLVLFYQKQVDQTMQKLKIPGFAGGVQLWKLIPIESDFTKSFARGQIFETLGIPTVQPGAPGGEGAPPPPKAAPPKKPGGSAEAKEARAFETEGSAKTEFGDFDGYFKAEIEDEESKISLRSFDNLSGWRNLAMTELMTLILPARYNYMFENKDADGQYTSRQELITAVKDFIDADDKSHDLITGTDIGPPEDMYYGKLELPYQCKNAPLDTLQELRMVRGVGDSFFAQFGDRLTAYPVQKMNLNSADDLMITALVCGFVKDKNHPFCTDTTGQMRKTVLERFQRFKGLKASQNMFYSPSLADIREFFTSEGIPLNDSIFGLGKMEDAVTSTSSFFTVKAYGKVGNVVKTITCVVFTGDGKSDILYWRED